MGLNCVACKVAWCAMRGQSLVVVDGQSASPMNVSEDDLRNNFEVLKVTLLRRPYSVSLEELRLAACALSAGCCRMCLGHVWLARLQ